MKSFGETIRNFRLDNKISLREVASDLSIDVGLMSKIERGLRMATREQVLDLAKFYKVKSDDLQILWLAEKLVQNIGNDELAMQALKVAEEQIEYQNFKKTDRKKILNKIIKGISKFKNIQKAWIYGSFARAEDGPKSDVDIAVQTDAGFNYFDLAEVQHQLELVLNRKVDVGFMDAFKPYILEHVKPDLKLIYERQAS